MARFGAKLMICAALAASGCATASDQEVGGIVLGAALGAAVGAQAAGSSDRALGAALGGALGAFLGREIGRALADDDRRYHDEAAERALWHDGYGRPYAWRNPRTGFRGEIAPLSGSYRDRFGRVCRPFSDTVIFPDGMRRTARGVACYEGGRWMIDRY